MRPLSSSTVALCYLTAHHYIRPSGQDGMYVYMMVLPLLSPLHIPHIWCPIWCPFLCPLVYLLYKGHIIGVLLDPHLLNDHLNTPY